MRTSEKIYNFALSHYKHIPNGKVIDADFALSNSACHFNAVAAARAGRADKVWLVWAGRKNGVVHFINSKNGKFFDETWHDDNDKSCYWIIREVKPHEYDNVYEILVATKKALISMFGSTWQRLRVGKKYHGII
tara:strand:+ start:606 stop:1007 length:402 start_codon:yes stop_codon:yes gene_type:complete